MLQLGFVSAILPDYSFEQVIDFASENRFACVEMMCWPVGRSERRYAGITHIDVDTLNAERIRGIQEYLLKKKVSISGLGYYPNPLDPDPSRAVASVQHIRKVIRAASLLGIPVVNTFIGRNPALDVDENLNLFKETWPPLVRYAEEQQIRIGIENCPMFFTGDEWPGGKNLATTPAIWDRLFEIIPSSNFGLNYDPSHLVWQMMDPIQPIYDYHSRFHHVHLKDAKIYKDRLNRVGIMANPLEFHSPKLPGLGDVNWSAFFSALTTVGYRGPVCIEVEDKAYEKSDGDRLTALLTARNYLSQFLVI